MDFVFKMMNFCIQNDDFRKALWNRGVCGTHSLLSFNWTSVGLSSTEPMAVRDIFEEQDLGTHTGQYTGWVDIDDVLMLRLSKPK